MESVRVEQSTAMTETLALMIPVWLASVSSLPTSLLALITTPALMETFVERLANVFLEYSSLALQTMLVWMPSVMRTMENVPLDLSLVLAMMETSVLATTSAKMENARELTLLPTVRMTTSVPLNTATPPLAVSLNSMRPNATMDWSALWMTPVTMDLVMECPRNATTMKNLAWLMFVVKNLLDVWEMNTTAAVLA